MNFLKSICQYLGFNRVATALGAHKPKPSLDQVAEILAASPRIVRRSLGITTKPEGVLVSVDQAVASQALNLLQGFEVSDPYRSGRGRLSFLVKA